MLKKHGFGHEDLVSIYATYIRPIAEYVSVVWNSTITAEQSADLERQQTRALSQAYGFGTSARKMLQLSGLDTLKKRRDKACLAFAKKCAGSERFSGWFTMRPQSNYPRRSRKYGEYFEPTARTDRYRNSAWTWWEDCWTMRDRGWLAAYLSLATLELLNLPYDFFFW